MNLQEAMLLVSNKNPSWAARSGEGPAYSQSQKIEFYDDGWAGNPER